MSSPLTSLLVRTTPQAVSCHTTAAAFMLPDYQHDLFACPHAMTGW